MISKSILQRLMAFEGVRITEKQIRELLQVKDYSEYYDLVIELIQEGLLDPVNSSGSNGMNPPLHKRYRLIKPQDDYDELIPEIRKLHSVFNIEGYLSNPERYMEHKDLLFRLDHFIKNKAESLKEAVSINERSFQIFFREKALKDDKVVRSILNFNEGLRDILNYYDTPEPFFTHNIFSYYEIGQAENVNILIIENKDTWYTLRRLMSPENNTLFCIPFHILLYGEGKKITRRSSTLRDYDDATLAGLKSTYYYAGDIDYEGIWIFNEVKAQNHVLDIRLMTTLYEKMLDKSSDVLLPLTKDNQSMPEMDTFLSNFEKPQRDRIMRILSAKKYIPQEILNAGDYKKYMVKGEINV
jgi:hypothetical protein